MIVDDNINNTKQSSMTAPRTKGLHPLKNHTQQSKMLLVKKKCKSHWEGEMTPNKNNNDNNQPVCGMVASSNTKVNGKRKNDAKNPGGVVPFK